MSRRRHRIAGGAAGTAGGAAGTAGGAASTGTGAQPAPTPTPSSADDVDPPPPQGTRIELVLGAIAAGGGCVARTEDGQVVFVRHALPGERVTAEVTATTASFLRADAVEVLDASENRVTPPCPHAGPGRCGGCDWQHVSLPAQRRLKSELVAEQLRRLARVDRRMEVEQVPGAPDGLHWRTRASFAVDGSGRAGFYRHRSHDIEPVPHCPIVTPEVDRAGAGIRRWKGARHIEVLASPDGSPPVVAVDSRGRWRPGTPVDGVGLVVDGRTVQHPERSQFNVLGREFAVSAGVFWQVHTAAATVLTQSVVDGLGPGRGERAADLYAGAGLFTVALAHAVGPRGGVVAVERNMYAWSDLVHNTAGLDQVRTVRTAVDPEVIAGELSGVDLVVLDPARRGAGRPVMEALASLDPPPRRLAYVSCDPASFSRDIRVLLDEGWSLVTLRGFDLFPMTEHIEVLGIFEPPAVAVVPLSV